MNQALGLIETVGLVAAIEAADTAVKAANVVLLGYEKTWRRHDHGQNYRRRRRVKPQSPPP